MSTKITMILPSDIYHRELVYQILYGAYASIRSTNTQPPEVMESIATLLHELEDHIDPNFAGNLRRITDQMWTNINSDNLFDMSMDFIASIKNPETQAPADTNIQGHKATDIHP